LLLALPATARPAQDGPNLGTVVNNDGLSADHSAAAVGFSVVPGDASLAVGANHVVQTAGLAMKGFDKQGSFSFGPLAISSLFTGFGAPCETPIPGDEGDTAVLYDPLADRWLVNHFEVQWGTVCVAASQTPDPTGPYFRYTFPLAGPGFVTRNMRVGLWPNALVYTTNEFTTTGIFLGVHINLVELSKVLVGDPSAGIVQVALPASGSPPVHRNLIPTSVWGPAPPAGTPIVVGEMFDDQRQGTGSGPDGIQLWEITPDFVNPPATVVNTRPFIPTASFQSNVCATQPCIPQLGGLDLDGSDSTTSRWVYRHFGAFKAIAGCSTVDAGANRAGIHWFELQNPSSGWGLHQEGIHAPPDDRHRWNASIGMNGIEDITLGFSVSAAFDYTSIRHAGRSKGDPLGTLGAEYVIAESGGAQTGTSRWGDYSTMSLDPSDDLSFWYTDQYYTASQPSTWRTRVTNIRANEPTVSTYCTAKALSCGTHPSLNLTGQPSATSSSGFSVSTHYTNGGKPGILAYTGAGQGSIPMPAGGVLCLAQPIRRSVPILDTTGTTGQCNGVLTIDLNAFAQGLLGGHPDAFLKTPGASVNGQFWTRDTPTTHGLSQAFEMTQRP
jgi:hypothetical protein